MDLLTLEGTPEVITGDVVGVGVMVVVRHFPGIVGEGKGHHGERPNDLVEGSRLGEVLVRTVVADNEETRRGRTQENYGEGHEVPGRDREQVEAHGHGEPHAASCEEREAQALLHCVLGQNAKNITQRFGIWGLRVLAGNGSNSRGLVLATRVVLHGLLLLQRHSSAS